MVTSRRFQGVLQAVSSRAVEKGILLSARSKLSLVPAPRLLLLSSFSTSTPTSVLLSSPKLPPHDVGFRLMYFVSLGKPSLYLL